MVNNCPFFNSGFVQSKGKAINPPLSPFLSLSFSLSLSLSFPLSFVIYLCYLKFLSSFWWDGQLCCLLLEKFAQEHWQLTKPIKEIGISTEIIWRWALIVTRDNTVAPFCRLIHFLPSDLKRGWNACDSATPSDDGNSTTLNWTQKGSLEHNWFFLAVVCT